MNDHEKLLKLAEALTEYDANRECPFCSKHEWGENKHDPKCPFAIAYVIIHEEENKS